MVYEIIPTRLGSIIPYKTPNLNLFLLLIYNIYLIFCALQGLLVHIQNGKTEKYQRLKNEKDMFPGGYWYLFIVYMGVSKNRGTPKWMVYNGKPY